MDTRPLLTIERNNAGTMFIGVTEFGDIGGTILAVRAYVLSMADKHTHDSVMRRRFEDMARLMGDNVRTEALV